MNKKLLLIVAFGLFPILLFGESFLRIVIKGKMNVNTGVICCTK